MAIVKPSRPNPNKGTPTADQDKAAESFIAGAGAPAQSPAVEPEPEAQQKKRGFMVYFDPDVLAKVDALAKRKGLSRSAWIHSLAITALEKDAKRQQ
jgi:hypothetical protein